jgi:hypothetical protein
MSQEETPTPESKPEAQQPPTAPPAEKKEKRREFTPEELTGFSPSAELQDILDSAKEEHENLEKQRQAVIENAQRTLAAIDGAQQQMKHFSGSQLSPLEVLPDPAPAESSTVAPPPPAPKPAAAKPSGRTRTRP